MRNDFPWTLKLLLLNVEVHAVVYCIPFKNSLKIYDTKTKENMVYSSKNETPLFSLLQ